MKTPLLPANGSQKSPRRMIILFLIIAGVLCFLDRFGQGVVDSERDIGTKTLAELTTMETKDLGDAFLDGEMLDNVPTGLHVLCIQMIGEAYPTIYGECKECGPAIAFVAEQNKEKKADVQAKKAKCLTNELSFIASGVVRDAVRKVVGECVSIRDGVASCMITDKDIRDYRWPTYEEMKPEERPPFNQPCTGKSSELTAKQAYETYVLPGAEFCAAAKMHNQEGNGDKAAKNMAKTTKLFEEFGTVCSNQLDSGGPEDTEKRASFWSGDIAISLYIRTQKYTPLESTTLGAAMDYKIMFDYLKLRGDKCINRFWTSISKAFTEAMRQQTVNVFLSAYRPDSAYFEKELERSLNNVNIQSTTFHFINNECKCPRPRNDETCLDELRKKHGEKFCEVYGDPIVCPHSSGSAEEKEKNLLGCMRKGLCNQQAVLRSRGFAVNWTPPPDETGKQAPWSSLLYHDPKEGGAVLYLPYTKGDTPRGISYEAIEGYVWDGFCEQWDLGEANRLTPPVPPKEAKKSAIVLNKQ